MNRFPRIRNTEKTFVRKNGRRNNVNRRRGIGNLVLPPRRLVIQGLFPAPRNSSIPPESIQIQKLLKRISKKKEWNGQRSEYINGFCEFCDFWDKKYGFCLIKRVKGVSCPFVNGNTNTICLTK